MSKTVWAVLLVVLVILLVGGVYVAVNFMGSEKTKATNNNNNLNLSEQTEQTEQTANKVNDNLQAEQPFVNIEKKYCPQMSFFL